MIVPLIILAVMFTVIPVEANSSGGSKSSKSASQKLTQTQAKQLKLTATKKPVRTSTMSKEKKCVTMIDNKTKKTYIVCPR